jgi:TolB protein
MRKIHLFLIVGLFITSCGNKKISTGKEEIKEKKYKIAYNVWAPDSAAPDNYEIFCMNIDGSENKNITGHKDVAWTYHAEKDKIFFISDRDTAYRNYFLYNMDRNGGNIKKVTGLRLEDSWMDSRNDGKELIVSGRIGKEIRYQLFIVNTVDGSFRQITHDTSAIFYDPVFSPDGKQIVFAYQKNKRDKSQHEELYIMNEDGSNMLQLTHYPENDPGLKTHQYKAGPPKWHPTENFISYHSFQNGKNSLYAVTPDGKKQWKLTDIKLSEGWHDWSTDGKWLTMDLLEENPKKYRIGLMNWKTKELKLLTDTTYTYQQAPVFVEIPE